MKNLEKYWRNKFNRLAKTDLSDWQRSCWWDHNTLRYHQHFVFSALKKFAKGKTLKIGDIGCGSGMYCMQLVNMGHQVIGIDFAERTLLVAKDRGCKKDVLLCSGDANELPIKIGSLDAVLSIGLLQTANDPWKQLAQLDFVLKPGGVLLLSTLSRHSKWELPWWPLYCLLYCDGFFSQIEFKQKLVKNREIMHPRPIDHISNSELMLKRFLSNDLSNKLKEMGYCKIVARNNSRFSRIPLLYNSFMINISAVKGH